MPDKRKPAPAIPFPEELAHLEAVRAKISAALRQAEESVLRHQRDYKDFMAYMAQHHGEIDPKEMLRSEQMLAAGARQSRICSSFPSRKVVRPT